VIVLAGLALMTAVGAFGIREAAAGDDIPIPVQATPTPDLLPLPAESPLPESP
jgi:hypothetical protein